MKGPFSLSEMKRRISALRKKMKELSIDCVVAMSYYHSYYLSGAPIFTFGRPIATLIPLDGEAVMVEAIREKEHTLEQSWIKDLRTYWDLERPPWETTLLLIKDFLEERQINKGKIGFEDEYIPVSYLQYMKKILPDATFVGISDILNKMRMVKSKEELKYIKIASNVVDVGMEKFLDTIKVGKTAHTIKRTVEEEMSMHILNKYPEVPFLVKGGTSIGQTWKNAGHSLWITHELRQKVRKGLNYGGMSVWIWGYWGNVERILIVDKASEQVKKHFNIMLEMHEAAIDAVKPGNKIPDVARASESVLKKHGYQIKYGAGCGRGLANYGDSLTSGRELKLDIRFYNEDLILPGMIFGVEPQIINDVGTFRHCNTILVTKSGNKVLSSIPRGMITV